MFEIAQRGLTLSEHYKDPSVVWSLSQVTEKHRSFSRGGTWRNITRRAKRS